MKTRIFLYIIVIIFTSCSSKSKSFFYNSSDGYFSLPDRLKIIKPINIKSELTVGFSDPFISLNPFYPLSDSDAFIISAVKGTLVYVNHRSGKIEPMLSESYTVSGNFMTYKFYLQRGLFFSDGSVLSVSDVVKSFAFLRTFLRGSNIYKAFLGDNEIVSVKTESEYSISLQLKYPDQLFLHKIASFPILKTSSLEGILSMDDLYNRNYTMAGVYLLDEISETSARLVRNPYYIRKKKEVSNVSEVINLRYFSDRNILFSDLCYGRVDLMRAESLEFEKYFNKTELSVRVINTGKSLNYTILGYKGSNPQKRFIEEFLKLSLPSLNVTGYLNEENNYTFDSNVRFFSPANHKLSRILVNYQETFFRESNIAYDIISYNSSQILSAVDGDTDDFYYLLPVNEREKDRFSPLIVFNEYELFFANPEAANIYYNPQLGSFPDIETLENIIVQKNLKSR